MNLQGCIIMGIKPEQRSDLLRVVRKLMEDGYLKDKVISNINNAACCLDILDSDAGYWSDNGNGLLGIIKHIRRNDKWKHMPRITATKLIEEFG